MEVEKAAAVVHMGSDEVLVDTVAEAGKRSSVAHTAVGVVEERAMQIDFVEVGTNFA